MILSNIIKDKYLRVISALSVLVLFLAAVIFYLKLWPITTPLIIHFDAYQGIDFLGSRIEVLGILLSGLAMILINYFIANFLYSRERFLSYIFSFVSLILTILILIAVNVIISVN